MAKRKERKRQAIPKDESKADRFKRVVAPRVSKAVKAIRQIGFCAGASYEYTPEQLKQIQEALDKSFAETLALFAGKKSGDAGFSFDG